MPETPGRVRIPEQQTHGIWESSIGYDPSAPSANYSNPNPASAIDNAISSWNEFLALTRIAHTSSAADMRSAWRNLKDYSDDSDDSPPTSLEDALCKMEETLRKSKETLRKLKEKYNFKDVDSESNSSNSDIDPEIEGILAERFNKKSKSKVPVQTESLSRASPNRNPLDEIRGRDPADSDNTSSEINKALQEVVIESKGLSEETIASFHLSKFRSGSSSRSKRPSDNCALCQSAIRKGEYIITLPCKHYFHKECITRWLKMNKVCCMCRYEVEDI